MKIREALLGEPDPSHSDAKELGKFVAGVVGAPLAWKYGVEQADGVDHLLYGLSATGLSVGLAVKSTRRIIRDKANWRNTHYDRIRRPNESSEIIPY